MAFKASHAQWLDAGVAVPEQHATNRFWEHTNTDPKECPACIDREKSGLISADNEHAQRLPVETPGVYEMLKVISTQLSAMIEVQQSMVAALGTSSDSRSSVALEQNSKGVNIAVKAYSGSDVEQAESAALEAYLRLKAQFDGVTA